MAGGLRNASMFTVKVLPLPRLTRLGAHGVLQLREEIKSRPPRPRGGCRFAGSHHRYQRQLVQEGRARWNPAPSERLREIAFVYCVQQYNFRGVARSGGSFDEGRGEMDDVAGALDILFAQPAMDADRLAVIGYSFGAR